MKKFFILFLIFINSLAFADVMPYYINSLRRYGIGFTSVKSPLVMRRTPSKEGEILETLNFDYKGNVSCLVNKSRCELDEIFAAYSGSNKISLLTTIDESENWSLVCFNQTDKPVCGWVDEKDNKYYNWGDFFNIYGKKYGLYLFKDLQKADKILYAAPLKQTNATGSIELPRAIFPWLVRGNWVLVKVLDFNNQNKTGWLNYRGDNGKLKLFVKFD
ncbi:hypothetical protein IJ531_02380 [bacterium]|nr:hypothetical protein [bacterium]